MAKHRVKFVIKALIQGVWMYYTEHYNDLPYDSVRNWNSDLYIARQYDSYPEAEAALVNGFEVQYWGGFFQVEKVFINS